MLRVRTFALLGCASVVLLSAGLAVAETRTPRFAYVTNLDDDTVSQYTINPATGLLTPMSPPTVPAGSTPTSVTVDPTGRFAYVANGNGSGPLVLTCPGGGAPPPPPVCGPGDGSVSAYTINPVTGALSVIGEYPTPGGRHAAWVTVDPCGKYLYVACECDAEIFAFRINQTTGALISDVPGSPFTAGFSPNALAVDPSDQFLYVTNEASHDVWAYRINYQNGSLTQIPGMFSEMGCQPSSVFVDGTNKYAYVGTGDQSSYVWAFSININTGELGTNVPSAPFMAGSSPEAVALDPFGRFLYAGNESDDSVSAYSIQCTGELLSNVPGSPFGTGSRPSFATIELSGKYLYVTNEDSNEVRVYSINQSNGALAPLQAVATGASPSSVVTLGSRCPGL